MLTLEKISQYIVSILPNVFISLCILIFGWILSKYLTKIIMKVIEKSSIDSSAEAFFRSSLLLVFRLLVVLIFLSQLGIDVTTIVTAVGAATVTIGLALQDTLGNVASGILLIFTQPFKEGDYLKVGDDEGTVIKIELFTTHINTLDNKEIVIPNKNVTSKSVVNYTSNENRRVELDFSIAYDNDLLEIKKIIRDVLEKDDRVMNNLETIIGISGHSDTCLTIDVKFWCLTSDYWDLYYKISEDINKAFEINNVRLPYRVVLNKELNN